MERQMMIDRVRREMPERRWRHTEGVMATAIILAERFGEDPERAELASILHDVAKFWPIERQRLILLEHQPSTDVLEYDKELWHAPVGAWVAKNEYGVEDGDVLNAIRYHTSGRQGMSKLEKIVWLADYIEPGRNSPGVEAIRELANTHLEQALLEAMDATIAFLIVKKKKIYPLTIEARNSMLDYENGGV